MNINQTWRRFVSAGLCLVLLAGSWGGTWAAPAAGLPNLGGDGDMSLGDERRLGERIARELFRDPDYIDDPLIMEYVQGIWQPLLAAARARGDITPELDTSMAWQILLGRDRSVNAFALPGGYFGLHLGLVGIVGSKDELGSVLAHEMSHVTQRHIQRMMSKQSQQTPWVLGTMILGVLAASKSPDAANALLMGGQALAVQNQLNFSRDMEREADRVGYGVLTQAGFAGRGFTAMFEKLQQSTRLTDSGAYPYLRSHPLTTERIADMQVRLPDAPGATKGQGVQSGVEAAMMAARARALAYPSAETLRLWQEEAQGLGFEALSRPRQLAALTGAVMADIRLREFAAGMKRVARLKRLAAGDPVAERVARVLAAELALAQEDFVGARQALGELAAPVARPELLLLAQAQLRSGQAQEAAQRLQTWVVVHPEDAAAWMALSAAQAAVGQTVASIHAEAEAQVAALDYAGAMARFKAAQERIKANGGAHSANDHIEASIIDTRARAVESLLRQQLSER